MINCPQCGTENRDSASYCRACGYALEAGGADIDEAGGAQEGAGTRDASREQSSPAAASGQETMDTAPLRRHPSRPEDTLPPVAPSDAPEAMAPAGFELLPDGAYVGDGANEYRVEEVVSDGAHLNVYTAVDVQGVRPCPVCGLFYNLPQENYCAYCGSEIGDLPVAYLSHFVKESDNAEELTVLAQLAQLGLVDPALRLPLHSFQKRVGGAPRYYVVLPPPPDRWLAEVEPPFSVRQVAAWGATLARGLALLHQEQVALGEADGRHAGLVGDRAVWANFEDVILSASQDELLADVDGLAELLAYLLSGSPYQPGMTLPEPLAPLIEQVLGTMPAISSASILAEELQEVQEVLERPESVDLRVGRMTDVGRQRELNEDSMLVMDLASSNRSISQPLGLYVVADGMGGHAAGEVASGLALEAMTRSATGQLLPAVTSGAEVALDSWLEEAVASANRAVHQAVLEAGNDMGTTLVAAVVSGDTAYIANVGDSRAYLVSPAEIRQITTDHSLVERLVATGQITREEARVHPQRNVIYRTIGDKGEVEVDQMRVRLRPGERLLLCSDGLSGMIDDQEIQRLALGAGSPQEACRQLVEAANAAGGEDNITVIIVLVTEA